MSERIHAPHVGAADPELRTAPVLEETDEAYAGQAQQLGESGACDFNSVSYARGAYVCSGDELLHCQDGVWLRQGSCDRDKP